MQNFIETKPTRCLDIIKLVFELTKNEGFIAGGFARYCLSNDPNPIVPSDIDVFCENKACYDRIVARMKANESVVKKSETRLETKFEYRILSGFHKDAYVIQIIRPTNIMNMISDGNYERVLNNFDFTISKCAILPDGRGFHHPAFREHDKTRTLVIEKIHCPISSTKRIIKYCKKGFSIDSKEILKLFDDFEKRSPEWKNIIREGLLVENPNTQEPEIRERLIETMYFD